MKLFVILLTTLSLAPLAAIEIATGKMLGQSYDARSFYVRDNPRQAWRKTYTGPQFKPEAAGRLMNLRIAQALFHDEWLTEFPFDPEQNTTRMIEALDAYKAHGILAVNISLQAGNPGYAKEFPAIQRDRAYKHGPGKGSHISGYRPDGSIKPEWLSRLKRVQQAADRRGMIVDLMYFYQGQDEVLANPEAIKRAVVETTDWLIDNNCRNVIIEIANEHDLRGWDHDEWIHKNLGELIELARSRFKAKGVDWVLPIGASTGPSMKIFDNVRKTSDLTMFHGNNRTVDEKRARTAELVKDSSMPGPVFMNEDDSGRDTTPEVLAKELASCDAVFSQGGSWGYMPWRQTQMFPFRHYLPAKTAQLKPGMSLEESDPVYFKAVLEHIRKLLYK